MKKLFNFFAMPCIAVASLLALGSLTSCSSDDDDDNGPSGSGSASGTITLDGKTTKMISGAVYVYEDGETEIQLSSLDFNKYLNNPGKLPSHYDGDVIIHIESEIPDSKTITVTPDKYEIEFSKDINRTDDPDYEGFKSEYAWAWCNFDNYLQAKTPGNMTVSRNGLNYTISVETIWLFGGKGCDGWENMSFDPRFGWAQGSLKWSGKLIDMSDYE